MQPLSAEHPESLDQRRLVLEEQKFAREVELKQQELELKRLEHRGRPFANPLFLAVVASAIGLLGNAAVAILNGKSTRDLEETRAATQLELQKAQAEAGLVLEAIKTGDTESAAANLDFLVSAGLVSTTPSLKNYLVQRKPGQGPVLPPERSANAAPIPDSLEQEVHRNVALFDSDDRKAAAARLVAVATRGAIEKRAVVSGCLSALAPIDDHYRTDLYAVLTLSRLEDGWCASEEQRRKVEELPVGHPRTVDDAFKHAHAAALEKYTGACESAQGVARSEKDARQAERRSTQH